MDDNPDENNGEVDIYGACDHTNAEEFYVDHEGDFSDFEDAEDYFNDRKIETAR